MHGSQAEKRMFTKKYSAYWFIAPFLLMFGTFWVWPILQSLIWSFYKWDGLSSPIVRGIQNYVALFRDYDFLVALKNTVVAAVVYIAVMTTIAILFGFLLSSRRLVGRSVFRTILFLPVTVSLPVVALVFLLIYAPNNGILNKVLLALGATHPVSWLGDPKTALWSIVALRVWRAVGYYSIFIIAGLHNIPRETVEAGRIDGARYSQLLRYILLPQLKSMIVYVIIVSSIWAFQLFEEPWILTQGGPMNATSTIAIYIYRNGFQYFRLGVASTSGYVLTLITLAFALLNLRISREK